jgi:hypothetical protein
VVVTTNGFERRLRMLEAAAEAEQVRRIVAEMAAPYGLSAAEVAQAAEVALARARRLTALEAIGLSEREAVREAYPDHDPDELIEKARRLAREREGACTRTTG